MANKTLLLSLAALITLAGLYCVQNDSAEPVVETLPILKDKPVVNLMVQDECTKKLAAECALVIEMTVRACSKAFETEGADIIADIKCAKDLLADKKLCWPCICYEAHQRGWHVIGC